LVVAPVHDVPVEVHWMPLSPPPPEQMPLLQLSLPGHWAHAAPPVPHRELV
jgi:hypothetical protein